MSVARPGLVPQRKQSAGPTLSIHGCAGLWGHFINNLIGLLQQMRTNLSSSEQQFEIHKVSDQQSQCNSNAVLCSVMFHVAADCRPDSVLWL